MNKHTQVMSTGGSTTQHRSDFGSHTRILGQNVHRESEPLVHRSFEDGRSQHPAKAVSVKMDTRKSKRTRIMMIGGQEKVSIVTKLSLYVFASARSTMRGEDTGLGSATNFASRTTKPYMLTTKTNSSTGGTVVEQQSLT